MHYSTNAGFLITIYITHKQLIIIVHKEIKKFMINFTI